jgi:hypothetical protein
LLKAGKLAEAYELTRDPDLKFTMEQFIVAK